MITHDLVIVQIPLVEKVLRTVAVYAGLAVLLRLAGKRELAQLNSFDLVVMLLLSNVVQNAIIGSDNSLLGGLFGAAVLVAINAAMVRLSSSSAAVERVFEGTATTVVQDGRYLDPALRHLGLRKADVSVALKRQNADDVTQVSDATLEPGGALVVTLDRESQNATYGDLQSLHRRLDAMEALLRSR